MTGRVTAIYGWLPKFQNFLILTKHEYLFPDRYVVYFFSSNDTHISLKLVQ